MSDKKKSPHRDKSKMEGVKKKKIIRKKNTTLEGFLSQYVIKKSDAKSGDIEAHIIADMLRIESVGLPTHRASALGPKATVANPFCTQNSSQRSSGQRPQPAKSFGK